MDGNLGVQCGEGGVFGRSEKENFKPLYCIIIVFAA
jgi:hypothetical protein